ncbi:MAG: S-methyl-5'-thioadenosine phosphorylase [Acidobacteria bacterium]|nr:S-methyl-5'-thioadenosine phosphorylase [Acidobacteriota bacterium]
MAEIEIGILGGSGLYAMEALRDIEERAVSTPFGDPSDRYVIGTLHGRRVAFLARHGRGHRHLPSELNFRANIYGFKTLGVNRILSASAVGSMKVELKPLQIVLPGQFIDRTYARKSTFFGDGLAAHVSMADPICGQLAGLVEKAAQRIGQPVKRGGVYLCIEGPQFSTRGESLLYRQWGVDVIGMTNVQEAKLAREAEICYCTVALVTDYDCWHEEEEPVTADRVLACLKQNALNAQKLVAAAVAEMPAAYSCACHRALEFAILTDRAAVPAETKRRLGLLVGKYLER